ncbi:hypothetical protein [Treponema bryantii]|uniref:hypothetical protein n=1 Tax=Treponema bryantii TaxID=163 RepID=UPI0003B3E885|nr:hypothetical protein [Treponema bryantii]
MKKINLVLCAAAIACTAFFASCDNGAKTYVDVTYENYENTYDLVSFTEVVKVSDAETDASGNAVTHNDITTTGVFTADTKSAKNSATISWKDSEVVDGFTSYSLKINKNVEGKGKSKTNDGDFSAEVDTNTNNEGITEANTKTWTFYKQDDKYYIKGASGNINLVSGDLEKDTTISFTDVVVQDRSGIKTKDAKDKYIRTTTTTYTIVLKASESL